MDKTKRVIADVSNREHRLIKAKAAGVGLSVKEIIRRFLCAWLEGKIELPQK